ncbi:MAG: NAD-dependent epimerase/dehydratase family protein, partial [Acidimicrobiia bacterium]|nr:NAD-dependent epimerase/dehydratase family protein [Acidimicrobiia bacterium]
EATRCLSRRLARLALPPGRTGHHRGPRRRAARRAGQQGRGRHRPLVGPGLPAAGAAQRPLRPPAHGQRGAAADRHPEPRRRRPSLGPLRRRRGHHAGLGPGRLGRGGAGLVAQPGRRAPPLPRPRRALVRRPRCRRPREGARGRGPRLTLPGRGLFVPDRPAGPECPTVIAEALAGTRIFITGSTGFLGTALVERLLRCVPRCQLVLLIRPGRRSGPAQRAKREIFRNDAFDRLRAELGGEAAFQALVDARVETVAGDVSRDGLGLDDAGRAALAAADLVVHSAASVSFDSPLDSAVEVNLLGPSRIAGAIRAAGGGPHFVTVSTCYVAGSRRGSALEEPVDASPFYVEVDWRAEVAAARRLRADADAQSRLPAQLARFRKAAQRELGAAGGPLLSEKTEQLRRRSVDDQLVEAGRSRAASVGYPDAYAFTKALAEKALAETKGDLPVTIVRPSIIESALLEPRPGWIRGFRMAEPVIISYARGLLKEFPGVPEGIVDVIPVDLVVAAIIDVAAGSPPPGSGPPAVLQVASGSANPLRYRRLVDLVSAWFAENPLYDRRGQPISVSPWTFPGRGRVQAQLRRTLKTVTVAERALSALPLRGRRADVAADLEQTREQAERAMGYVVLYGAYAECEAVYGVSRLLERWDRLDAADQATFAFDPRVIDWSRYLSDVHLPSVVEHARVRTAPGRAVEDRSVRLRRQVLHPDRHFAAFDLENTLVASNVVASYSWLASRNLRGADRARFVARALAEAPGLLALDRRDRSDFLRSFYRRYQGASAAVLTEESYEHASAYILRRAFPAGLRRVREHRRAGHRTVLITGALDFIIEPLRPLFDDVVCAGARRGRRGPVHGELTAAPPTGESRAQALFDYAADQGFDPAEGVAYADSTSDLPMLEAVGFPVATNPEARLAALARKRGWLVENFEPAPGAPKPLPLARPATSAMRNP